MKTAEKGKKKKKKRAFRDRMTWGFSITTAVPLCRTYGRARCCRKK